MQREERLVPYQSITVADGNSCPWHACDTPGVDTLLLQGLSEELPKVLLPLCRGSGYHQPPVGPQAQVQFLPKNSDIEVEPVRLWSGSSGALGAAGHPRVTGV